MSEGFFYTYFGDALYKRLHDQQAQRMERACIHLENAVKKELGTKSPPASAPGDFPHLVSGELRRSITHEVDRAKVTGRVGTNKLYSRFLILGTRYMEPREFLDRTLKAERGRISQILKGR
jgi:hypothetical protein